MKIGVGYGWDQVIVVAWDANTGSEHVTTWGSNAKYCNQAAEGGNFVKKALGWPENLCRAKSKSASAHLEKVSQLYEKGKDMVVEILPPCTASQSDIDALYSVLSELRDLAVISIKEVAHES